MKFLKTVFMTLIIWNSVSAQSTFKNEYGDSFDSGIINSIVSDSSGYLITGTKLRLIPNVVAIAIKTDPDGRILWQRNFGDTSSRFSLASCTKMTNGTYLLIAFDQVLLKSHLYNIDGLGNIIYQKVIFNCIARDLVQKYPNEIVLIGNLPSGFSIIAMDSTLNTTWTRSYGVNESANAYRISHTDDNGFLILYSRPPTDYDFITKIDSTGNIVWSKILNSHYHNSSVTETTNGDLFLVSIWDSTSAKYGVRIDKLDNAGNLIWSENLSGIYDYEILRSLITTPDDGCLILAYVKSPSTMFATLMIKLDSSGNIVWSETIGDYSDMSNPVQIINTIDSAYALLCNKWGSGHILFKMDSVGFAGCPGTPYPMTVHPFVTSITDDTISTDTTSIQFVNISVPFDTTSLTMNQICFVNKVGEVVSNSLNIFPSPFKDKLTVQDTKSEGQIKVYDLTGRIFIDRKTLSGETELNTSFLGKGFYMIRYDEQGKTYFTKAIKY